MSDSRVALKNVFRWGVVIANFKILVDILSDCAGLSTVTGWANSRRKERTRGPRLRRRHKAVIQKPASSAVTHCF